MENQNAQSLAKIDACIVIEKCQNAICQMNKQREKENKQYIRQRQQEHNRTWRCRRAWRKTWSFNDAKKEIEKESISNPWVHWFYPSTYGSITVIIANQLINLAQNTVDESDTMNESKHVLVSRNDWAWIMTT